MRRITLFSLLSIFFSSCGKGDYGYSISDVKATSIVMIASLSNILDEQSGAGFSFVPSSLCLDRAGIQACNNGRKSITYNGCEATNSSLTGTVSLAYSDNGCSINTVSNTVTRSFDLTRENADGSQDQIYEDNLVDYLGNLYGNGSRLTAQGAQLHQLAILGKHISKSRANGFEGYQISMRTTSDITVVSGNNDLRRDGRSLSGGVVELAHNRLSYLTTYTIGSLTYSPGCCHPISGTINFSISEGAEGSGQIQFNNTCGSASLTLSDVTETMFIGDCNY